jgi:hypothetical protein
LSEEPTAQSTLDQESLRACQFFDSAGDIFSMYLEFAREEDKKMAEGWKADADGILIFVGFRPPALCFTQLTVRSKTGLFSAAVAALISISIQDIRPNPQDTTNFYLQNIYQVQVLDPNRTDTSPFPSGPPPFSPPKYAVWVNLLWFMSLIISLTCALLATLLQQWARKYIGDTQPRVSPHKRAQVHAYFAEGVETLHLPRAVHILPTLLHLSLFLFLAGVVLFLCHVCPKIYDVVLPWTCICAVLYGIITFMPIFRHDSPYSTPLSSTVWFIMNGIGYVSLRPFRPVASERLRNSEKMYRQSLLRGMRKTVNESAQNSPSKVDGHVFMRTFDSLEKDDELERFFSGIPGFRCSKVIADPLPGLTKPEKRRLFEELLEFMDRTFTSDVLTEEVKKRRATICESAINPADISGAFRWMLDKILTIDQYHGLKTAQFGRVVKTWGDSANKRGAVAAQTIVSVILARAQRRETIPWLDLATDQLKVSKSVLRGHTSNDVSLANLIHITRGLFGLLGDKNPRNPLGLGPTALKAVSQFDTRDTSPELQHNFCALWNEIVAKGGRLYAQEILKHIRHVYLALHKGTNSAPTRFSESTRDSAWILDQPSSYPSCKICEHRPAETGPRTAVLQLRNYMTDPTSVHQTTFEEHRLSQASTSRGPTTANATQGIIDTSARTVPPPTPETSTPTPPLASTSPSQHNAGLRTPSDELDHPSPPIPGSEDILRTNSPSFSRSLPEFHPSILASSPPGTLRPPSFPDLGAGTEEGGSVSYFAQGQGSLEPDPL